MADLVISFVYCPGYYPVFSSYPAPRDSAEVCYPLSISPAFDAGLATSIASDIIRFLVHILLRVKARRFTPSIAPDVIRISKLLPYR